VVRASNLRLNGREFDSRPPHYRSVGTGMCDRLRADIPSRYVTSHPGQLNLLPSVGRKMYRPKRDDALRLGSKSKIAHSIRGQTCGWQVKLCDLSLTRAILSALDVSLHEKALYKYPVFNFFNCVTS